MIDPTPCERCGWRYGGFHICIDLSAPEPTVSVPSPKATTKRQDKDRQRAYDRAYRARWRAQHPKPQRVCIEDECSNPVDREGWRCEDCGRRNRNEKARIRNARSRAKKAKK